MPWAEQAPLYLAADAFVMDNDAPKFNIEERLTKADGSAIWLRTNKIPLHDSDGRVLGILGSYEDVTAQKEAETALRAVKEETERANAAKDEFLSRMSHELRTPMNSILGFTQIMEMDAPTDAQVVRLGHIMQAGRRLLQLMDETFDWVFAESGSVQPPSKAPLRKED